MAFKQLNSSQSQNHIYENNVREFSRMLKEDLLNKNVKMYMKELILALTTIELIEQLGFFKWKHLFSPTFRYFKNKKTFQDFKNSVREKIDGYVIKKITEDDGPRGQLYKECMGEK